MPLSHRCCISSSSVFIASLFAEVIRDNCNLKHALTVWCLPAHGVGRIFFITVMVFALPDYDAIMPGLRRDSVSDDAIASCLFPGSIPCWVSCCQGASWGIVDFFGDYVEPIPHEREVCDWNLGACKCVKMREKSARICFSRLLLLMQSLSAEPPRAREENMAHGECGSSACYPSNK